MKLKSTHRIIPIDGRGKTHDHLVWVGNEPDKPCSGSKSIVRY